MNFKVEKVANMIFISNGDTIFKAWNEDDFTEKKLNNAMNKIANNYNGTAKFEKLF